MAETIALINMKGGVGKTTLAVNLAWHTYKTRKKVLLVDLDPQFNASQYLMDFETYRKHVAANGTIADLLIDSPTFTLRKKATRPPVKSVVARIKKGHSADSPCFDLIPAELALSHVVKNPAQMEFKLEKLLSTVRKNYDFIFIDCAPTDSVLTTMTFTASDYLLIPMRPDRFSVLGFGMVLETIKRFRENSHDPHHVRDLGVVFTQVHSSVDIEQQCMAEIEKAAAKHGTYVFNSKLGFSQTFLRAVQNQTPAFNTKYAREDLKENIRQLSKEMRTRINTLGAEEDEE